VVGFTPSHFTPAVRALAIFLIGGWVGPITCLDAVAKTKKPITALAGNRL